MLPKMSNNSPCSINKFPANSAPCQPVKWRKASVFSNVHNWCFCFSGCLGWGERQRSQQPEQQALEPTTGHQESTRCLQKTGEDLAREPALCGGSYAEKQPRKAPGRFACPWSLDHRHFWWEWGLVPLWATQSTHWACIKRTKCTTHTPT